MNPIDVLIIQLSGIFLVSVLIFFLSKSLKSKALIYWRNAWMALSIALFGLLIYFASGHSFHAKPFVIVYYALEYIFGFYLIAGCQNFSNGKEITHKSVWLLIPTVIFSGFMAYASGSFNAIFNLHSLIMSAIFLTAFFALKSSVKTSHNNYGWYVTKSALLLLSICFFHRIIVFSLINTGYGDWIPSRYHIYNPIADLVFEILLGFGIITIVMERVRTEVENTNKKLNEAHKKLKKLANVDPLTAAFTRHAFYSFLKKHENKTDKLSGCVGVFDIDNLKPINDRLGHHIGDFAIRAVCNQVRNLIRADDMLFRWGGDEFIVVMLGFQSEKAQERMLILDDKLERIRVRELNQIISVGVSCGFADFEDIQDLEKTIQRADKIMYKVKEKRKAKQENEFAYLPIQEINSPKPSISQ